MELIENDPQVSEEAKQEGQKIFQELVSSTQHWIEEGAYKAIPIELIHMTFWNICSILIRYCKAHKQNSVDNIFLNMVWDAVKA
jgi:hypothetical protein